mgnify:CR=1 FL=1
MSPSRLSAAEAARLLGISPAAIRKRCRLGQLLGHRDRSGCWQIDRGALDEATGRDTRSDERLARLDPELVERLITALGYGADTPAETARRAANTERRLRALERQVVGLVTELRERMAG